MKISLEPQRISLLTLEFCIGQYSREVGVTVMKKRSLAQHEFGGWRVGFSSQDVHTLLRFPGAWEWQLLSRHPWLWWPLVALLEKAGLQWDEMSPLVLWSVPPYLWCCCCCCGLLVQPFLPSHPAAIPCHNHCFPWKSCLCLFSRPGWKPGCGKSWYSIVFRALSPDISRVWRTGQRKISLHLPAANHVSLRSSPTFLETQYISFWDIYIS